MSIFEVLTLYPSRAKASSKSAHRNPSNLAPKASQKMIYGVFMILVTRSLESRCWVSDKNLLKIGRLNFLHMDSMNL